MQDDQFVLTTCNLCGCSDYMALFCEQSAGTSFRVVRCRQCGLIYTNPQPSDEFLYRLYDDESYQSRTVSGAYCVDAAVSGVDFVPVLTALRSFISMGRLLDVGCGTGLFMKAALRAGWDAYGVEPSPYAFGKAARDLGERVKLGTVEEARFPAGYFDAVTAWYVLEHVRRPMQLLAEIHRMLRPKGVIFVAVPNARYVLIRRSLTRLLTGKLGKVHAEEHLYQYAQGTLRLFMRSAGFEPVREQIASPYYCSGTTGNLAKRASWLLARAVFALTGINLGGLMILGRKPENI